ncbi:MAG: NAD(P)H-dependent oxidoreductase subunit E [Deltaproteobacteria bacterium]|nr:NAD(P)H-dependent oxidoreductase subunit E [Deltaproteobacteria bacterium]
MPVTACKECTCETSEEQLTAQFLDILKGYPVEPGSLIPLLQTAQRMLGYLPEKVLKQIALKLDKPYSEVAGVVSFYSFFSTTPKGKHLVRVCLGTSCYVRGGKEVLEACKKQLNIDVGQTTEDRLFSLDVGRCFGACGLAPVMLVDDNVHKRVKPSKIGEIFSLYKEQVSEKK